MRSLRMAYDTRIRIADSAVGDPGQRRVMNSAILRHVASFEIPCLAVASPSERTRCPIEPIVRSERQFRRRLGRRMIGISPREKFAERRGVVVIARCPSYNQHRK